ncbi:MAG: lipopolysaccharide biosynthesis protein [Terracidiphilus sp.]
MRRDSRNRKALASAGVGITQRLAQAGCTLILMPMLLHALGAARFGVWGAAASLAWLAWIADLGTGSALVTLVARAIALDRLDEARRQVAGALTLGFSLSLFFLVLTGAAWRWRGAGDLAVYLIAVAGLAANLPLSSANNIWMALQEGYISSAWELVQTVATTVALIAATFYTKDVRVFVALVYGGLVMSNLGSLIHLYLRHPELRPERLPERWAAAHDVISSGLMFFLMGIAGSLTFILDNVLALQLLGPQASAQMTIAIRICMTGMGMLTAMAQPLWPAFADAAHRADHQWVMHKFAWGMALITGVTVAGSAILLVWGETLLKLWLHTDLGIGIGLLSAVAVWVVAQALFRVPHNLMNGLLMIRYQTIVFAAALGAAFALKFLLARSLGVAGILWGTNLAMFLIVLPACLWRIWQWAKDSKA